MQGDLMAMPAILSLSKVTVAVFVAENAHNQAYHAHHH